MKYESKEAFEKANIFGTGTANTAHAQYFIGNSFLNPLTDPKSGLGRYGSSVFPISCGMTLKTCCRIAE